MHYRGPDDEGIFVTEDGRLGLASRRLAIRDVSPAGHMPMQNAAGTVWITYNGEIYNADELRCELEASGFAFRSTSDTEVILHGYEAWGMRVLDRLRGMFALAVFDRRAAPCLVLARDPLGIKPLYYASTSDAFAFASECRALRTAGCAGRELDADGLVAYLELGSVPAPLTIYRDIRAMEAGHSLRLTWDEAGCLKSERPYQYWALPEPTPPPHDYRAAVDLVRETLQDSVRRHLVSDVPLGAFLSGGIDSASVVALMRASSPSATIRTCSVTFDEAEFTEEAYATAVAREFGTEHVNIPLSADDMAAEFDNIIAALDQPSNDGVNTYFVSQAARRAGLTVSLSGVGGDELFGGYPTFQRMPDLVRAMRVIDGVPGGSRLAGALLATGGMHRGPGRLASWLRSEGPLHVRAYLALRGLFSPTDVSHLISPEVRSSSRTFDLEDLVDRSAKAARPISTRELTSRLELTSYMRHQLLRDTDVMSMAHSLEVRVPFVDREVVEKLLGVGLQTPNGALSKQVLRDAVPTVPSVVRDRRDKHGFTFPFAVWMRGPLRTRLEETVRSVEQELTAYLDPQACEQVLHAFDAGEVHWSRAWALAALACVA